MNTSTLDYLTLPRAYLSAVISLRVDFYPGPPVKVALRLEDMQSDLDRMIASAATHFVDQSCVMLHRDELEAEGRMAIRNVLIKDWLTRARNRVEFFKIAKTAVMNRIRSLVQQHRFTQKRTGRKPPNRNEPLSWESHRPNEVSLDDPDAHLQVGEAYTEAEIDAVELEKEIRLRLEGLPLFVFDAMLELPLTALKLAELDAYRGRRAQRCRIRITEQNIAEALQIPVELYRKAVLQVQNVTRQVRSMNPELQDYEFTVEHLSSVFGVQVPKSMPTMLVRRLFTIAAWNQVEKVTPEVSDKLEMIGAKVPKWNGSTVSCFGILYNEGNKTCESCGVKESCASEAANAGLGTIVYSHRALGARAQRTAYILPNAQARSEPPVTSSWRDSEIADYLHRNFARVSHQSETYYRPKDFKDKSKLLFCIGARTIPFRLRFCNPSQKLRPRLEKRGRMYYAPASGSAEEVIALIDEHVRNAYAVH